MPSLPPVFQVRDQPGVEGVNLGIRRRIESYEDGVALVAAFGTEGRSERLASAVLASGRGAQGVTNAFECRRRCDLGQIGPGDGRTDEQQGQRRERTFEQVENDDLGECRKSGSQISHIATETMRTSAYQAELRDAKACNRRLPEGICAYLNLRAKTAGATL